MIQKFADAPWLPELAFVLAIVMLLTAHGINIQATIGSAK